MTQPERMAPGHVYQAATGTGIEWRPGTARLWEHGRVTGTGRHATASPWEFWHTLAFAATFPAVTHWWFGSAWTGPVWLGTRGVSPDGATITGWMQFVDPQEPALPWQITLRAPPQVATPLPPFEVWPINLPLRLALAQLALGLHRGDVRAAPAPEARAAADATVAAPGRPPARVAAASAAVPGHFVTSLVRRDDLAAVFPTTAGAWRLAQVAPPLREALCRLMGLQLPR